MWTPTQTAAALAYHGRPENQLVVDSTRYRGSTQATIGWNRVARTRFRADCADVLDIDITDDDITISPVDVDTTGLTVRLVPAWSPDSLVVEFRGGPTHGQIMQVMDLRPVRVHALSGPVVSPSASDSAVRVTEVEYRLSMWLPRARRWVFTPA